MLYLLIKFVTRTESRRNITWWRG